MKKLLGIIVCSVFFTAILNAQNEKFKALYIFNFTKYIEWSGEYKNGDFQIAVLGSSDVISALQTVAASKKVGEQPIVISKISSVEEIGVANIVYLPPSKSAKLSEVVNSLKGKQTLVISDTPDGSSQGAAINLVSVDNKQKFEIVKSAIESKGLKVSSALLSLGIAL